MFSKIFHSKSAPEAWFDAAMNNDADSICHMLDIHPEYLNLPDSNNTGWHMRSWTALHYAATNNGKEVVQLLIEHGASVSCKDCNGETPLYYAGNSEIKKLLQASQRIERTRKHQVDRERAEIARKDQLDHERAEAARKTQLDREKVEAARKAELDQERVETARKVQLDQERAEAEKKAQADQERAETARKDHRESAEAGRKAFVDEEAARKDQLDQESVEARRTALVDQELKRAEAERKDQLARERGEAGRKARADRESAEAARKDQLDRKDKNGSRKVFDHFRQLIASSLHLKSSQTQLQQDLEKLSLSEVYQALVECGIRDYDQAYLLNEELWAAIAKSYPRILPPKFVAAKNLIHSKAPQATEVCHKETEKKAPEKSNKARQKKKKGVKENASKSTPSATSSEDTDCAVCFEKKINAAFDPCGHMACCYDCSKRLDNCPICRNNITKTIKIFR